MSMNRGIKNKEENSY